MFRWFIFLFCSLALTACSAQTVSPAVTKIAITPSSASTSLPPEAPTAIPTITVDQLGVTDPNVVKAFTGATFKQEADGSYSVSAVSYNQETKVTADYKIDKTTFSINPEIKNAYAPATVQTTDGKTLIWDGEHGSWRVPFAMVDNSALDKIDQIPFVPEGDQKIAVESALLYLKDHPPFPDDPKTGKNPAVESYKKYGGNSLLFRYENDGKIVVLKSKGNDQKNLAQNVATMKASNLWVWQIIDGVRQDMPLIVNLDPADPKNPKADEFKIILGVHGDDLTKVQLEKDRLNIIEAFYKKGNFTFPRMILFGDEKYLKNNPLLASLLALPGNDPGKLNFPGYNVPFQSAFDKGTYPGETLIKFSDKYEPLPPEIQLMRLLIELAVNP
ncbi:MAG: DUF3558 domain-containing protein [Chloroflexi bacterium]|nr:DUF3558 domain-containing protein [Chloroflexota bacterium]